MEIEQDAYFNIIWFAVDRSGNVIAAQSLESDIPHFVRNDEEKTTCLAQRLLSLNAIERDGKNSLDVQQTASRHGFYCYQADDPYESVYRLVGVPHKPVSVRELPEQIRTLLQDNTVSFDAPSTASFVVEDGEIRAIMS